MLTDTQKTCLLEVARAAARARVLGQQFERPAICRGAGWPDVCGVFVTLKRHGVLRGCLGTLENRLGLAEEVARCAADSASEDPRFTAVGADELAEVHIELSVLGPLEPIDPQPNAFTPGVHGLVVEFGARRGLLLPQVATEWGWTAEEFLRHTCLKAGLPPDAWRKGAHVYRFSAEVFGD